MGEKSSLLRTKFLRRWQGLLIHSRWPAFIGTYVRILLTKYRQVVSSLAVHRGEDEHRPNSPKLVFHARVVFAHGF